MLKAILHAAFLSVCFQVADWPVITPPKVDPPKPAAVDVLPKGKLYVVTNDGDPAQLLCSPPGVVRIKEYKTQVIIDGDFVDGGEDSREYKAKQVFLVKRIQPGAFELLRVPAGLVDRRLLSDVVPEPMPPGPGPTPPGPGPSPTPAKTFRVIFAVESGDTLTAAQAGVVYGAAVESWCLKNCTGGKDGFRRRDKDNPSVTGGELAEVWKAALPKITTTPVAIVEKNSHIEIIALESTPEAMIAVFNEYLTGKRGK